MDLARKRKTAIAAYLLYIAAYYLILAFEIEPFISHTSTVGLVGEAIALVVGLAMFPGLEESLTMLSKRAQRAR